MNNISVMITGAAGSIGCEIAKQLCIANVKNLILCDIAESPLHQIALEINDTHPNIKYSAILADVRNKTVMRKIFEQYNPQYIFHAAACKHVPLIEDNPCQAVLTNISGTKTVADLAAEFNTECFVMISTDKAVNPGSVMGASKRIAELYVQSLKGATRFITTRFGNVIDSNGSVIPRFREQIKRGGPLTVTHRDVVRYFMTINEACRLVIKACEMGQGGEIFVFDMNEPVKIINLAEEMIRKAGYKPYKDIDIVITGLRAGEKLYEDILYKNETAENTMHNKIKVVKTNCANTMTVPNMALETLLANAENGDNLATVKTMKEIIPEFKSCNSIYSSLD
ncbi:MAG: SDR family NAD(P)-dependent oxidoreductase [Dysgonamonadaceae bacterium]|jgi:FlaA1/EpsC-like NDP-sugar epimerase|nr:SDR family NAD(P)-dependent oxidoreductase [Dysgonamonadaceae bacterium]